MGQGRPRLQLIGSTCQSDLLVQTTPTHHPCRNHPCWHCLQLLPEDCIGIRKISMVIQAVKIFPLPMLLTRILYLPDIPPFVHTTFLAASPYPLETHRYVLIIFLNTSLYLPEIPPLVTVSARRLERDNLDLNRPRTPNLERSIMSWFWPLPMPLRR